MPRSRVEAAAISEHVDQLVDASREVLAINNLIVDREVERLRASADEVQRGLILLLLFSTAVALTIALALTRYIARPIVAIDAAIRQLGGADFSRPIAVRGPEDLRYLGRRLDWLRRRLDEFETQKNRFLRHISHELKTPLTALREGAELLNDQVAGPLVPAQQHAAYRAERRAERLGLGTCSRSPASIGRTSRRRYRPSTASSLRRASSARTARAAASGSTTPISLPSSDGDRSTSSPGAAREATAARKAFAR